VGAGSVHDQRTRRLAEAIERIELPLSPPSPCPYLPGRRATHASLLPAPLLPGVYHSLMDLNFRRAGRVFYRPSCGECRECRMTRVSVAHFEPSRAQRRCSRRNADLDVRVGRPEPDTSKLALYRRYLAARHDGQMQGSPDEFHGFLYESPLDTLEIVYRHQGRVVAVGIADAEPQALSAVYCYFDPDLAPRSLGVFNVLRLLEEARRRGCSWLYLGFYVASCAAMSYKEDYRPCELLLADGSWERREARGADAHPPHA
jgi:arginine-tRNA-protein transferase